MRGRYSTPLVHAFGVRFGTLLHTGVILNEPYSRWAEMVIAQLHSVEEISNNLRSKVPQGLISISDVPQSPISEDLM